MKDGTASHTARSVAAHRLEFDRITAADGDPAADRSLTADVADGREPNRGRMHEYLRARTAFFDLAVVNALDRGVRQVVIGGAGYDGRALRYARPGVRWFELDHPSTQADKLERVGRLGVQTGHIQFIPADFTADPIAGPLLAAGLDPAASALFLLEGVAVYLERSVVERVLVAFRQVAADGSELAISVSVASSTSQARTRFRERVAELGEPARSEFTHDQARDLLAEVGWEAAAGPGRQLAVGLLLARTVPTSTVPASAALAAAASRALSAPSSAAAPKASPAVRTAPAAPTALASSAATSPPLPLSALLSAVLVAFTIEADNEAEHRLPHRTTNDGRSPGATAGAPWLTSLLMWANCLRHLPDDGITVAELRRRARTGTNLDGMRRWGYITVVPDPGRGKRPRPDAIIAPTPAGRRARAVWQAVTEEVEVRCRARFGPALIDRLRAALADLVDRLDPALPDCLPILGHGLRSTPRPDAPARPDSMAHPGSPGPADLPLWALLSRPLLAFALQYERAPGPSLAVSATVLRVLSADGVRVRDLPALAGISKEAVAMAVGLLAETGLATEGPDPAGSRFTVIRLTAAGTAARDAYPVLAADIEADWRDRLGVDRVAALRAALEPLTVGDPPPLLAALEPYPDNWRARLRPPAVLPHYPMTLHRGGYPDGA
ncbi:MAG TPA: SAM-dependent methyltransferase [Trebonia sp.]|nr:SAM-dependent methyltransferase [Trebonia sp.]